MTRLGPGDAFPSMQVHRPKAAYLSLPDDVAGHFGVVLFNRGAWCPYCSAQLSSFQHAKDDLAAVDARVVALSVDDETATQAMIDKLGLQFPVGHGADANLLAQKTGAFINSDPLFVQATGFVLDPTGHVLVSVYSSGAIGRLVPADVIGLIRYVNRAADGAA